MDGSFLRFDFSENAEIFLASITVVDPRQDGTHDRRDNSKNMTQKHFERSTIEQTLALGGNANFLLLKAF